MRIDRPPQPLLPPALSSLHPVRVAGHDRHGGKEDAFRATTRGLSTLGARLSSSSRSLGHLSDATGAVGLNHTAVHTGLAVASVGLGIIDGFQAHAAFREGNRSLGWLNVVGGASNVVSGGISVGEAMQLHPQLASWGAAAGSVGIFCDAAEDFVDASRLGADHPNRFWLCGRGSVKTAGAGFMLAGALSGEPTLQLLGNLVTISGVAVHYLPPPGQHGKR